MDSHVDSDANQSGPKFASPARREGLPISISPTSRGHPPVLSTSIADTFCASYFPEDAPDISLRPRSHSYPEAPLGLIPPHVSQTSRLANISEGEASERIGDFPIRQTGRGHSMKKRRLDRAAISKIMTRAEEELPEDWTVFGELFQDQHAPIINENRSNMRQAKDLGNVGGADNDDMANRVASDVIHHWRTLVSTSRSNRALDEERAERVASSSSAPTQPVDILSRGPFLRMPQSSPVGSPPTLTSSPVANRAPEEPTSPIRLAVDGQEDNLTRNPLSVDYGAINGDRRPTRLPSSSSSSSDSDSDTPRPVPHQAHHSGLFFFKQPWRAEVPSISTLHRNMLKCAIAYFIASLFTFVPFLSKLISDISTFGHGHGLPSPSAHMIATISVYYNPAKTAGGMFEADVFCIMGIAFSTLVACGSSFSSWIMDNRPSLGWLGDLIILSWIAIAMMLVSWAKVWINKASFNTAASMTSIIMFIVVVKEGGFVTLGQVIISVFVGAAIANIICFIIWPQSAQANLQHNIITSLDSYATLLEMLTSSFLLDPRFKGRSHLMRAVEAHQAGFTSLKRNLDEARSEWVLDPPDAPRSRRRFRQKSLSDLYEEAVDSLNRLAQHLAGLRSGTKLQRDLTLVYGKRCLKRPREDNAPNTKTNNGNPAVLVEEHIEANELDEEATAMAAAAAAFGDLVDDVGSPMEALTDACTNTLKGMRKVLIHDRQQTKHIMSLFGGRPAEHEQDFSELSLSIQRALFQFDNTSNQALMGLYRKSAVTETASLHSSVDGHQDENETIFLVYFFIFTLQEFARELVSLVDVIGQLHEAQMDALPYRGLAGWFWRIFQFKRRNDSAGFLATDRERLNGDSGRTTGITTFLDRRPALRRRFSNLVPLEPSRSGHPAFPKMRAHTPNTTQTPSRSSLSLIGGIQQQLWLFQQHLRNADFRYSFKVGVSTALLAAPAFIDATRPIFVEWRGEWALISFFVVMGQTIGSTNFLALHRVLGTLFGAGTAVLAFVWLSPYPALLAIFGFFFSLPCFYYIVGRPEYATTGRFVLLSYNLTALFTYNAAPRHLSVYEVAFHRAISVIAGVLWALVVSRVWWPSEARRELGISLSDFLLNLGWLYNRLVTTYSVPPNALARQAVNAESGIAIPILGSTAALVEDHTGLLVDEHTGLLGAAVTSGLNTNIREFVAMELHLQIQLIKLQKLLSQAQHEPRLKGPFPVSLYRSILTSLQTILDLFHSMRCVTTREEWYTSIRRDFVIPVNRQRREMVGNVILFFSVLSSAFQLKKPLTPYFPPAERSRRRLVEALRNLTIVRERRVQSSRQLLYFAYALMMKGVIAELEVLGKALQDGFGVIGQTTEEFEALFRP